VPVLRPLAYSETGLVRKTNQDSGYVSGTMLLVADGMGGAAAGDLASAAAVRQLRAADDPDHPGPAGLRLVVNQANAQIAQLISADPAREGMGTTVCGGVFDGQRLNVVHIGDSRGYLVSHGELRRLTHDHSYVQTLVDEGRLDELTAMVHPHRSLLLKVLNGQPEIAPDYFSVPLQVGDRVMFCSDGLCGMVADQAIATMLALPELDQAMEGLVNLAYAAGGTDNITIALADVVATDDAEDQAAPADTADPPTPVATDPAEDTAGPAGVSHTIQEALPLAAYVTAGLIGAAADPATVSTLSRSHWGADPAEVSDLAPAEPAPRAHLTQAARERARYTPSARKSRKGFWLVAIAVVLVLTGGGWGVYAYISHQYFIGAQAGQVAIFRGLPGDVAGIATWRVAETTTIALSDLPTVWRDQVQDTIRMPNGLEQARSAVQQLRERAQACLATRLARPPGAATGQDGC
jgi:protein phosphatase